MPPKIFILLIIPNLIEFANANLLNELKFYILLKNKKPFRKTERLYLLHTTCSCHSLDYSRKI